MKRLVLFIILIVSSFSLSAQQSEELEQLKRDLASKKDSINRLQKKASTIQSKIDGMPGWRKAAFGTIGANLSSFNNWFSRNTPDVNAGNIGITVNAYANLLEEKFFWRNTANINLSWVKLDNKNVSGDEGFSAATDVFNLTSLYGRKINKKWALSGLAEYRTTIIENFNNPGYLDFGVGFTWTPTPRLVVVMHPANYNTVFSKGNSVFTSSPGAKLVADYTATYHKVSVKSQFSMFESYKDSDLSNWTWTNSFGYKLWENIGVGFDFGLRDNLQEAANFQNVSLADADNKLQTFYLLGLSYAF